MLVCALFALDRGLWQDDALTLSIVHGRYGLFQKLFGPIVSPTRRLQGVPYALALMFPAPVLVLQAWYCVNWFLAGLLAFLVLRELFPGRESLAFLGGCLTLCSTGDFLVGSLVALDYELSATAYFVALLSLLLWWRRGEKRWLLLSAVFLSASVWMNDGTFASVVLTPVILWIANDFRLSRRLGWTAAFWYAVFAPYLAVFLRFLMVPWGYAARAFIKQAPADRLRSCLSLFLHNFNPWSWGPGRKNWFEAPPPVIPRWLVAVAAVAGVAVVLAVGSRLRHHEGPREPAERTSKMLRLAVLFLALALLSNAIFASVHLAEYFYRTQTVSRYWSSFALASVGSWLGSQRRRGRASIALVVSVVFVALGIVGGMNRQDYYLGYWRRHRQELKSILECAPQMGPNESLVLKVPAGHEYYLTTGAEYLARSWTTVLYDDPSLSPENVQMNRTFLWAAERGTDCVPAGSLLQCRGELAGEQRFIPLDGAVLIEYRRDVNRYRREDRATKPTLRESGYPSSLGRSILEAPVFLARFLFQPENEPPPPLSKNASKVPPAAPLEGHLDAIHALGSPGPQFTVKRGSRGEALGWALIDGQRRPHEVVLLIDGREVGRTSEFLARRDVSASFRRETDPCGWQIIFSTGQLTIGSHVVQVLVLKSPGSAPRPLESAAALEVLP